MKKRWISIMLGILGLLLIYELVNNRLSFFLIILGSVSFLLRNRVPEKAQNKFIIVGLFSFMLALFSSRFALAIIFVFLIIFIGDNPKIIRSVREMVSDTQNYKSSTDFVMINFDKSQPEPAKLTTTPWLGDDSKSEDDIYSWEDVNYTKVIGDTIFDLGNTILPKEQNVILVRKGLGNTKILVPEGVAISLDVSVILGKVIIGQDELALKNENFKWYSKNYSKSTRKVKFISNALIGEVEVVFL